MNPFFDFQSFLKFRPHTLVLTLVDGYLLATAQSAVRKEKFTVRVDEDVYLPSDVSWLAENVRWNVAEYLARLLGDVPAHTLAMAAKTWSKGLRQFLTQSWAMVTGTLAT